MADNLLIADGHVVTIHYTLTNDAGQILESTRTQDALQYVHGAGKLVSGLEQQLQGKGVGERFLASIPPQDGFGEYKQPGPQPLNRNAFPEDADLSEGAKHTVKSESGDVFDVWIKRVSEDQVYVDANHPLAGITLNFDVEVLNIRRATNDEVAEGKPQD